MLGPLPPLYRWIVCILALVACIGAGAWLASTLPVVTPTGATTGAVAGAVLGGIVVMLVLHDRDHSSSGSRGARRTR